MSAVVVSYSNPHAARASVDSLLAQTAPPCEVLVVDNGSQTGDALRWDDPSVRVLRPGRNLGYAGACNLAVRAAQGSWTLFLNPDAEAEPQCLERLLEAVDDTVAVAGAQVLLPDGVTTNAGDNPVHLSGLSWAGRYLEAREHGAPRDTAAVSGAALLVRTAAFRALNGYCEPFFLYHDDVDLCWRARLAGWRVRYVPEAVVRHAYEFDKGPRKWFWLERNRTWMVLSNYAPRTLALLAPLLLASEVGIAWRAHQDGWLREKVRAWASVGRNAPQIRRWRGQVQAQRVVPDAALLCSFVGAMRTPLVQSALLERVNPLMELYRRALLRLIDRRQDGQRPAVGSSRPRSSAAGQHAERIGRRP